MFAQHGVVPNESGQGFRLAARPRLEWALYYDKQTPTECYDRLTDISVPLQAIMPERPFAVPPKMFEADLHKMKQEVEVQWLQGTTHQIVYEKMDACAGFVADWLAKVAGEKRARLADGMNEKHLPFEPEDDRHGGTKPRPVGRL
ncbi:hypothetical protein NM208_g1537 [Fusarium decemcellulare]|uniref:Uncharacterized protein n=1 Tax=Fusarium decemcellulare TaxID=57161 RepID=A0ACC1SWB1_9HYPO|nr:hypothetical protein NM208_g1537 [Fusarium decemcellulare]